MEDGTPGDSPFSGVWIMDPSILSGNHPPWAEVNSPGVGHNFFLNVPTTGQENFPNVPTPGQISCLKLSIFVSISIIFVDTFKAKLLPKSEINKIELFAECSGGVPGGRRIPHPRTIFFSELTRSGWGVGVRKN